MVGCRPPEQAGSDDQCAHFYETEEPCPCLCRMVVAHPRSAPSQQRCPCIEGYLVLLRDRHWHSLPHGEHLVKEWQDMYLSTCPEFP